MVDSFVDESPRAIDPGIVAASIAVIILATAAVVSGGVSRYMRRMPLKADDYLIVTAPVSYSSIYLIRVRRSPITNNYTELLVWSMFACNIISEYTQRRSKLPVLTLLSGQIWSSNPMGPSG